LTTARDAARKRTRLYAHGVAAQLSTSKLEALRKGILEFNDVVANRINAAADAAPRAASPAEAS
jgi:hypothetical protein